MPHHQSHELAKRLQAGDNEAATAVFDRYVARLVALARSRLSPRVRRRVDADDIVQSAFRSFFLHARDDAYELTHSGDLWRLLAQITLHKLYRAVDRQQAKRRSVLREDNASSALNATAAPEPTPAEVVALVEQLRLLNDRLSHDEQLVLAQRLQGIATDEIAASIGKSPRTIRRILAGLNERFEQYLAGEPGDTLADHITRAEQVGDPRITLRADEFVLERLIGVGGMGKVYRARNCATGQIVAVKTLRKLHQADQRATDQFVQEADILATLRHPNVVGVHGLGRFPGGGLFIVMEYVAGQNLQERLRRGRLDIQQAIGIFRQVAAAVCCAHEIGIVHADLKPANVLLDGMNRAVVTDFGFARFLVGGHAPNSSHIGGTIGYMAPEVLRLGQRPTIAADIFGLGALLWELATGYRPDAQLTCGEFTDAIALVEPVCRRCLAERPCDRFQNVDDLLRALPEHIA